VAVPTVLQIWTPAPSICFEPVTTCSQCTHQQQNHIGVGDNACCDKQRRVLCNGGHQAHVREPSVNTQHGNQHT
jgi:hypothetical protein